MALAAFAAAMWAGGVATGLRLPLYVAAALAVILAGSAAHAALLAWRLRAVAEPGERVVERGERVDVPVRVAGAFAARDVRICPVEGEAGVGPDAPSREALIVAGTETGPGALMLVPHAYGAWIIEPPRAHATDLLGLWRVRSRHGGRPTPASAASLLVLPRAVPGPIAAPRTAAGAEELSPFARPYIPGDDVRRLHWKATARTGELMTRDTEPAEQPLAIVALAPRARAGAQGPQRELAADIAASLAQRWADAGLDVAVATSRGVQPLDHGKDARAVLAREAGDGAGAVPGTVPGTVAGGVPQHRLRDALIVLVDAPRDPGAGPAQHESDPREGLPAELAHVADVQVLPAEGSLEDALARVAAPHGRRRS